MLLNAQIKKCMGRGGRAYQIGDCMRWSKKQHIAQARQTVGQRIYSFYLFREKGRKLGEAGVVGRGEN